MTKEANKALVRRYFEEFHNRKHFRALDECLSEDYVHHTPDLPGHTMGLEDYRERELGITMAFPDQQWTIEDQIGEGAKVVTRATMRGTQTGNMPNIPAEGHRIEVWFTFVHRIADGRIAEGWETYDSLGMMLQLDVVQMVTTLGKAHHERGYYPFSNYTG